LRGLTALGKTDWDMPIGYDRLRIRMATQGMDHENTINILENKIKVLGGMNYISVDNINKANKNRSDNFNKFISASYPYIKSKADEGSAATGLDKLVQDYYKIFGKPKNDDTTTNATNDTSTTNGSKCPLIPSSNDLSGRANDGVSSKQLPKVL
jgi:hypothetical protein